MQWSHSLTNSFVHSHCILSSHHVSDYYQKGDDESVILKGQNADKNKLDKLKTPCATETGKQKAGEYLTAHSASCVSSGWS